MQFAELKKFLNHNYKKYSNKSFIATDPISIPHQYNKKQDIEIAALFAALFAWGNRKTIINKTNELLSLMDNSPHQFCTQHNDNDLKKLLGFKHRTFNDSDLLYFVHFLKKHYLKNNSLETAFFPNKKIDTVEKALNNFYDYFINDSLFLSRTKKHISAPFKKSACKRLNMFLRWMVRKDDVDFGIWQSIKPAELICPIDVHVSKVAANLGLLTANNNKWFEAVSLTQNLKKFDNNDPVKYDFALFGLSAFENT